MQSNVMIKKSLRTIFFIFLLNFLNQSLIYADCDVLTITEIMKLNAQISYMPCHLAFAFEYEKLPLTDDHYLHPYKGFFHETFVLTIPQGQVCGLDGWVIADNSLIHELIWQRVYPSADELQKAKENLRVIPTSRVAVIAQSGHNYYYHWIVEVLGRLALLEMHGVEYDFLYVPTHAPYMKETLQLWGIDSSKIITASNDYMVIADALIVPSLVANVTVDGCPRLVHYIPSYIVHYVREKLLRKIEQQKNDYHFNKKIFISRQDASARKILNEDEVFTLLETQGFQRYYLTQLSILEQIMLFKNAEIIVSALGSGLSNILFCNPDVQIIELYQARRDSTIWNLSQMVGLRNHTCIKTTEFIDWYEGQYDTEIPLHVIEEIILSLNKSSNR